MTNKKTPCEHEWSIQKHQDPYFIECSKCKTQFWKIMKQEGIRIGYAKGVKDTEDALGVVTGKDAKRFLKKTGLKL